MEGWTCPKWLEDLEKEYVAWLNMSPEQQQKYTSPGEWRYGKIFVIKQIRNH